MNKYFEIIIISFLALNTVFLLYISFFKTDAMSLEVMKAGWKENFVMVKKLYQEPWYISQQKDGIQQALNSLWVE